MLVFCLLYLPILTTQSLFMYASSELCDCAVRTFCQGWCPFFMFIINIFCVVRPVFCLFMWWCTSWVILLSLCVVGGLLYSFLPLHRWTVWKQVSPVMYVSEFLTKVRLSNTKYLLVVSVCYDLSLLGLSYSFIILVIYILLPYEILCTAFE